ncbi:hypothetical protein GE09DRAFT_1267827 [Coniochaeta sp. 2T2.1]|nr:hypothetical protein GE09DRAFT_1267827 [Coniochaeta sp. 2T2.1]
MVPRNRWLALPPEIRIMVLALVEKDHCFRTEPYARAGYASVTREWQAYFEPLNFHRLVVDQDRLGELKRITSGGYRHRFVKHLFLRLRLQENCLVCQLPEGLESASAPKTFTNAVRELLAILCKWPSRDVNEGGITLELGVYSPSDSSSTGIYLSDSSRNYCGTRSLPSLPFAMRDGATCLKAASYNTNKPTYD